MPGTLPAVPIPSNVVVRSVTPTQLSVAHNLRRITRTMGYHRWMLDLTWTQVKREDMAEVFTFILKQQGQFSNYNVIIPGHQTPRGVYDSGSDSPAVNGPGQSGTSISTTGWRNNTSGLLLKGDYIRFTTHAKVYVVVEDFDSNGSGEGDLEIYPAVQDTPVDTDPIVCDGVSMTVASAQDVAETPVSPPLLYSFTLSVIEDPT